MNKRKREAKLYDRIKEDTKLNRTKIHSNHPWMSAQLNHGWDLYLPYVDTRNMRIWIYPSVRSWLSLDAMFCVMFYFFFVLRYDVLSSSFVSQMVRQNMRRLFFYTLHSLSHNKWNKLLVMFTIWCFAEFRAWFVRIVFCLLPLTDTWVVRKLISALFSDTLRKYNSEINYYMVY